MCRTARPHPASPTAHPARTPKAPWYRVLQLIGRLIWVLSIRCKVLGEEHLRATGPMILASSHISHLEPFLLSAHIWRKIEWMTRVEFFRRSWISNLLWRVGAFPVNRTGVPVSTMRIALERLRQGRLIGICPEGGVATGPLSACRGGMIRGGVGLLAYRTGAPVIPCVLLGTHKLNAVWPYLPFRRGRLWIAFGKPIYADRTLDRRAGRKKLTADLLSQYGVLYQQLLQTYGLFDSDTP